MSVRLEAVSAAADAVPARELLREYAAGLDFDLCFQNFEQELRDLPGCYASPRGRLLLAHRDGELAGCVALRPLTAEVGEVKRLYVRPTHRGCGLGRQLVAAVIEAGREAGYRRLCLDTHPSMTAAQCCTATWAFSRRSRTVTIRTPVCCTSRWSWAAPTPRRSPVADPVYVSTSTRAKRKRGLLVARQR